MINLNKIIPKASNEEKKTEKTLVLLLLSIILISIGIVLLLVGRYYNYLFLDSIGSTAIGSGIIGILYDTLVRKESSKDLHKELVNVIHDWGHINQLNDDTREKVILKFFETYTTKELAKGCWESLIKPMFLQKGKLIREHFSHSAIIKRLDESKLAKISINIQYTEKNKGTKSCNLFKNIMPRFAIISDPKYFSYCKEQGRYIYMFSTPLNLSDFYEKYNNIKIFQSLWIRYGIVACCHNRPLDLCGECASL